MGRITGGRGANKYWLWAFVALSTVFSVRYLVWRVGYTLNPSALWFALPLILAEIHGFVETSLYFFMTWNPTRRISPPPLKDRAVDVFVPIFNEPLDILRMTLLGCNDITYPHTTYVCDDGHREEVRALTSEMGCEYLSRPDNKGAKGGNMNYALKHSTGEFIVTLDTDHVPLPSLIEETIGFFADEGVALVQMPQDFYNLDSFQHSTDWKRKHSWHEQELFYSVIQPGKDYWNAAFYCGSTTLIRRTALDEIGGFATETVTEDIHTALRLQAKGWGSVYYNKTLARGIAPEDLYSFSLQRLRWGEGSMQVWKLDNPLTIKGLTIPQRLCYAASMYSYFDGFQKMVYLITPILILFTGILPIQTDGYTFAKYFFPYFLISAYTMSLTQGGLKGMFSIEQYNIIKLVNQMRAVIEGFLKPVKYRVTPKGSQNTTDWENLLLPLVLGVLSISAVTWGVYHIYTGFRENLWAHVASITWATLYIVLMFPIIITGFRKKEHRKMYRFDGLFDVTVTYGPQGVPVQQFQNSGYARNITPYGCSVTTDTNHEVGEGIQLRLCLPKDVCVDAHGVVRRSTEIHLPGGKTKYICGIEFQDVSREVWDTLTRFLMNVAAKKQAQFLELSKATRIEG